MSYIQYQQQFAKDLIADVDQSAISEDTKKAKRHIDLGIDLKTLVDNLIDALPYYFDPDMDKAHRNALANLVESQLPNDQIAPQPMSSSWGVINTYTYNGNYSGYKNAFYTDIGLNVLSQKVLEAVMGVSPTLNQVWWGNYGVPILTDAIRQKVTVTLDTNKLTSSLQTHHSAFLPSLSASYFTVLTLGFSPVVQALQPITSSGMTSQAGALLKKAIQEPSFIANINEGLDAGGQSTTAATWFLFNLWMALKVLEYEDVDSAITDFVNAGMKVPPQVQAKNWWNGSYVSWYVPLSGADVLAQATNTITTTMPQEKQISYQGYPTYENVATPNGYSLSFCEWGELNIFKPSSCFGRGTQVLLGDGTSKPIEEVRPEEIVMTGQGPKRVIMVESPKRGGRKLHQINKLPLFVTDAHPFLSGDEGGAKYLAIDPWGLVDGIPTFLETGVGRLEVGAKLSSLKHGKVSSESVVQIDVLPEVESSSNELVYDLLLENWEIDQPSYYVGGPKVFLAARAEWIDPTFNLSLSATFIKALEIAVPYSRKFINNPAFDLSSLVARLDFDKIEKNAKKEVHQFLGNRELPELKLPDPSFYMVNGKWDPHASILGYYLVRQFGRPIRSLLLTNWRVNNQREKQEEFLAFGLFQMEMIDYPLGGTDKVSLEFDIIGKRFTEHCGTIKYNLEIKNEKRWLLEIDDTILLGNLHINDVDNSLVISVLSNDLYLGKCRISLSQLETLHGYSDCFIFSPQGAAIGRIGFDLRSLSNLDLKREQQQKEKTTQSGEMPLAYCIGKQMGHELSNWMEVNSTKDK